MTGFKCLLINWNSLAAWVVLRGLEGGGVLYLGLSALVHAEPRKVSPTSDDHIFPRIYAYTYSRQYFRQFALYLARFMQRIVPLDARAHVILQLGEINPWFGSGACSSPPNYVLIQQQILRNCG